MAYIQYIARPLEWPLIENLNEMSVAIKSKSLSELLKTDPYFYGPLTCTDEEFAKNAWQGKKEDCDALKTYVDAVIAEIKEKFNTATSSDRKTIVDYVTFPQKSLQQAAVIRGGYSDNHVRFAWGPLQSPAFHALARLEGYKSLNDAIDFWEDKVMQVKSVRDMEAFLKKGGLAYIRAASGALNWTMRDRVGELLRNETNQKTLNQWANLANKYQLGELNEIVIDRIQSLNEPQPTTQKLHNSQPMRLFKLYAKLIIEFKLLFLYLLPVFLLLAR